MADHSDVWGRAREIVRIDRRDVIGRPWNVFVGNRQVATWQSEEAAKLSGDNVIHAIKEALDEHERATIQRCISALEKIEIEYSMYNETVQLCADTLRKLLGGP